jgi:dephospho-CoA kinase
MTTTSQIKFGITGMTGSGKSYICKLFNDRYGIPIFNSDDSAKILLNTNADLKDKITEEFGDVYLNDIIDSNKLRGIVFVEGGEDRLKKLNQIVHPYVFEEFDKFCVRNEDSKIIIAESAILYESKMEKYLDSIIFVHCDEKVRMKRAFDRSGFSENDYKGRMKSQISSDEKMKIADYTIFNSGGEDLESQIEEIIDYIKEENEI